MATRTAGPARSPVTKPSMVPAAMNIVTSPMTTVMAPALVGHRFGP
jgi:hypothetical protein